MARRWRDPAAFRADPAAVPSARPSGRQSLTLLLVLVLVAGSVALASYLIRPDKARAFDLLHGSLFLSDARGPVAVDLASAKPTIRINDAAATVDLPTGQQPTVVPLDSGTLLLNGDTGEFNLIDSTGFVVKHDGGVPLPQRSGPTAAVAIPVDDSAYTGAFIEQTGPSGTSVYLVTPTTVTSAITSRTVKPRGFISMKAPGSTADGAAATAGGSLWLLLGSDTRHTVRRLSVPPNSSTGAALRSTDHGTVTGPAALGSTSAGATAAGTVGLATRDHITLFTGGARHTLPFTAPAGVDHILPASDQVGRLSFLFHGTDGWSVASVDADGSGLRRPAAVSGLPTDASLLEPAQSRDALYTMDRNTGAVYRIDGTGATRLAGYPLVLEKGNNYSDAYVIARQSRVIVNSPSHREALAIFTDGSRAPLLIQKGAGVLVSAVGGAEELAQAHIGKPKPNSSEPPPTPPKNAPPPQQAPPPSTNHLRCNKSGQQPHIPQDVTGAAGSRSVLVSWTYPILDRDDCMARTYEVSVKLLSNGAPQLPGSGSVPVRDLTSVNITGLFPSTRYSLTVTAYIGTQGASAPPITIETGPEGPAAPTDVQVVADAAGNWDLRWTSCGSIQQNCVPVASWNVVPSYCDGVGVGGQLPKVPYPAEPSSKQQPPAVYHGGAALLGRGLSFQIEGVGRDQSTGTPSAPTKCVTSWALPVRSALTLTASHPPPTSLGGTAATTVDLDLGPDATTDVGGLGASITLTLTGPAGPQTKQVTYDGRSTHISATFGGIVAGATYTAGATVSPPGPGGHSVTLPPVPVTTRANWPAALAIDAHCPRTGLGLTCDLTVNIGGLSSAAAGGERFDLTDSDLRCGTTTRTLALTDFDPSQTPVTLDNLSQLDQLVGTCTVVINLVENAESPAPLIFGGTVSPVLTTTVDLGAPARANLGANDVDVVWGDTAVVKISAHDADAQNRIDTLTKDWTEEVDAPDGTVCGTSSSAGPQDLAVASSCVDQHGGDPGKWTVKITYADKSDGKTETLPVYTLPGPAPGYQACTPDQFIAGWGATIAQGVTVSYLGTDPDVLAGCSKWQYTLFDPTGTSCGTAAGPPSTTDGTVAQIALTCATAPSTGWTVEIDYQDTAGNPQKLTVGVDGEPPES